MVRWNGHPISRAETVTLMPMTEGVQRDGYFYDHAYHDFVMLSILEEEFRRP